jgi:NADH-quinone oxidoreductase subunit G
MESKPAWKVIRVMGNVWEMPGFNQESAKAISDELGIRYGDMEMPVVKAGIDVSEWMTAPRENESLPKGTLCRLAPVSLYAVDGVVRRAKSLQATKDAQLAEVRLSNKQAQALDLKEGALVWVQQGSSQSQVPLPIVIDDGVPMGAAVVAAAMMQTTSLGAPFGHITLHIAPSAHDREGQ